MAQAVAESDHPSYPKAAGQGGDVGGEGLDRVLARVRLWPCRAGEPRTRASGEVLELRAEEADRHTSRVEQSSGGSPGRPYRMPGDSSAILPSN